MTDKWKLQFDDGDVAVLKIVLEHVVMQNKRVVEEERTKDLYAIDKVAHHVCLNDCQRILDYITSTTG